jgi:hypothetical protein
MTKNSLFVCLLLFAVVGVAQPPVPQLPLTYIDTTFNPPTGVTWPAHTSTDFKNALNSASPGDTIVLDAGVTYQGNFTFPVKSNPTNQWIYIVGSALSSLPAPGTRVNPATDAAQMPKIVSTNVTAPLTFAVAANHYRLVGLEVYGASTYGCNPSATPPVNCFGYALIGDVSAIGKTPPDSITIDRCYVHGQPNIDQRRAIGVNASNLAVIDSYINEIHMPGFDTQAIAEWFSPGPIKIVNNLLSASSEDVSFGGAGGLNNPWVAADIEIRNNHFYKPLSWAQVGVSIPPNNTMVVKNNLEFKSARRVLVDGNTFENTWVSGQMGFSLMLTPVTSQSGLLAVVDDITISNNVLKNVSSGFDITSFDNSCFPSGGCTNPGEAKRVVFYNNLILLGDTTQVGYTTGYAYGGIINKQVTDFVLQHNTVVAPPNLGYCKGSWQFNASPPWTPSSSSTHNVWILDNALCRQINGPAGIVGQFSYVLPDYMGDPSPVNSRLLGNVFYAPRPDSVYPLPPHNYISTVPFTYVNPSGGNYQLSVPTWTDTSDGKISGVNSSTLP